MAEILRGPQRYKKEVWVVGESDDFILGVYSTEGKALDAVALKRASLKEGHEDFWWVEPYPLDPVEA